jgi:hypothetical protein
MSFKEYILTLNLIIKRRLNYEEKNKHKVEY